MNHIRGCLNKIVLGLLPGLLALAVMKALPGEKKVVTLNGQVIDSETAQPLPARIYIQGEDGTWHFPRSQSPQGSAVEYRKQRPNIPRSVEMHTTLSAHPFTVDLPPGKYTITVERGHEYYPETRKVNLGKEAKKETFKLRRWIDMAGHGWYSGETHVHRTLEELPNVMLAEDLNVAFPLLYWVTEAFAPPRSGPRSTKHDPEAKLIAVDPTHVIYPRNTEYEIFTVGKKPHALGAFFVIHHKTIFEKGTPPVRPIALQAHAEGALIDLDKPNWPWSMILAALIKIDLYELANNHVWRTEFGFPSFGEPAPEFMKIQRDARGFTEWGWLDFNFKNYYTLLNCGFRIRPSAGTASGVHPVPLGFGRVYIPLEKGFDFDRWVQGLNGGRSFVSTGPMLFAKVDGNLPGHIFKGQAEKTYKVTGKALSAYPLQRIEILVNGEVAQTLKPQNRPAREGSCETDFDAQIKIDGSSWIVVRCFEERSEKRIRFAHTAPWHIEREGNPLRPRRAEIEFLIQRVQDQITRSQEVLPAAALAEYQEALGVYRKIAQSTQINEK